MSKVETTKEKVLEAARNNPQSKKLLTDLFPDAFVDNTVLCQIGSIFFRLDYPDNVYAIMKQEHKIVVLNISHSAKWTEKKAIRVSDLRDVNQLSITVSEFSKLTGYTDLSKFVISNRPDNRKLLTLLMTGYVGKM